MMTRIKSAFEHEGYRVEFKRSSLEERLKSAGRNGYSLFFMQDPFHDRALNLRRAYYYPFWRIENTAERWDFDVARKHYDSGEIDTETAVEWANKWRKWLFKGKAKEPTKEGVVYVPLQGRLLEKRSFQTASPVDMIKAVLEHDPERRIILGLHPGEEYSPEEMAALESIDDANPRVSVQLGGMERVLGVCDYVVTENSSAALSGFFFHKPAILFAKIDFHHIGLNVADIGVAQAFERVAGHRPGYDAYLYWFIQLNAIKADDEKAEADIIKAARRCGWQV